MRAPWQQPNVPTWGRGSKQMGHRHLLMENQVWPCSKVSFTTAHSEHAHTLRMDTTTLHSWSFGVFFQTIRFSMAISVLPVTSREEGMKFISQLSVPLLCGEIHFVSTFWFRSRTFRNLDGSKGWRSNFYWLFQLLFKSYLKMTHKFFWGKTSYTLHL